jgi:hypothetical protein
MTSGWLRFFLWFLVVALGGAGLTIFGPAVSRCVGAEPGETCPLVRYAQMSWRAKTITAVNLCPTSVAISVKYIDDEDLPQVVGWQDIPPESSAEIHAGDGVPVVSYGPNYDFKVVHSGERQCLPDPRRVDMKTANIFDSPEAWWAQTTRIRVACP